MAKQSSVNFAYHSPTGTAQSTGWIRFGASLSIAAFFILFLFSGGDGKLNDDNLRSGQAHHKTEAKEPFVTKPNNPGAADSHTPYAVGDTKIDEKNLQEAVGKATEGIKEAEEVQLQEEVSMLDSTSSNIANRVRIGMGRLFGNTLSIDEVDEVANQVQGQLVAEATTTLRAQADDIVKREIDNLEGLVEDEVKEGNEANAIKEDVYEVELSAVDAVEDDIDAAASSVRSSLRARAAEIEKAILEERLSAKLGKRVKLVIVEDEVKVAQGDDELFHGLNALAPSSSLASSTAIGSGILGDFNSVQKSEAATTAGSLPYHGSYPVSHTDNKTATSNTTAHIVTSPSYPIASTPIVSASSRYREPVASKEGRKDSNKREKDKKYDKNSSE